jgi:hypothetical protein
MMIKIEDVEATVGSIIEVSVTIYHNPGVLGAVLTFEYDSRLTLIDSRAGEGWSQLHLTKPAQYNSPCNFVWDGSNGADTNDGTILVLTFIVSSNAEIGSVYDISASYTDGNILDGNFENVDLTIESGSVTVVRLMGDVNDDGIVDVADVITLRRYMAGGYGVTINEEQADMNQDGMITVTDIIMLRRYVVNWSY